MKLKQLLIVLALTLVSISSYCQYPKTKRIGQDSVVIMTVQQGDYINTLYKQYRFQIDSLKIDAQLNRAAIDSLQHKYDSLGRVMYDAAQYKWKYEANREIFFKMEKDEEKRTKLHEISKILLVGIIILQFTTISSLQDQINH